MRNSQFWVLAERKSPVSGHSAASIFQRHKLPSTCIIELTPDELIYIWPKECRFDSLCLICKNLNAKSAEVCNRDVPIGYPCTFEAVPEADLCQDLDDFLVDGEYIVECGYFYSFEDFKKQNGFTDENSFSFFLGDFPLVRFAREAMEDTSI